MGKKNKILICGAGALGSNVAANLVSARTGAEIAVVDYDRVENRNVQAGTQFFFREQIGLSKVDALQYNLYKWFGSQIEVYNCKLSNGIVGGWSLIIDCLDNYGGRKIIQHWARATKIPCLHAGFSGQITFEIEWDEYYRIPDDEKTDFDICEAVGARSFIQSVAGLTGSVVLEYLQSGKKVRLLGNKFVSRIVK